MILTCPNCGTEITTALLTERDIVVFDLLSLGMSHKTIAEKLNIAVPTVRQWIAAATARIGAQNTTHAIALYTKGKSSERLVQLPDSQIFARDPALPGGRATQ